MYGYVRIFKPELKFCEYDIYRSYYCGLCRCLKENYGIISCTVLNYDMIFLILLLTGLYEPETSFTKGRCVISPKKQLFRKNEITDYAADMLVIYSYFKSIDNKNDEKKILGTFEELILKPAFKKVSSKNYKDKIDKIMMLLKEEQKAEKISNYSFEVPAHFTGKVIGELFAYKDDIWCSHLKKIGYFLGKYIYVLDAYEDIEYDIKKGCFNPFKDDYLKMPRNEFDEYCKEIMLNYISECADEFEILPIEKNVEILRNILYLGVWERFAEIKSKNTD